MTLIQRKFMVGILADGEQVDARSLTVKMEYSPDNIELATRIADTMNAIEDVIARRKRGQKVEFDVRELKVVR